MTRLPKFVYSRLRRQQQKAAAHPDPELLTGFVERCLSTRDRAEVVSHLAVCPDCREAVALTSQIEPAEPVSPSAPAIHTWSKLYWATGLAAACLFIAMAWRLAPSVAPSQKPASAPTPDGVALNKRVQPRAYVEPDQLKTVVPSRVMPDMTAKRSVHDNLAIARKPRVASAEVQVSQLRPIEHPTVQLGLPNSNENVRRAFAPLPASQQPVFAGLPEQAPPAMQQLQVTQPTSVSDGLLEKEPPYAHGEAKQKKALGFSAPFMAGSRQPSGVSGNLARVPAATAQATSVWRLDSAAGPADSESALQRSDDGGRSWYNVRVADNAHLYALSSFAADVWVGGADGALFHSADDGLHWTSVSVPDSAAPMHAVITRIELLGGKSVKLTVKGGGQWVTFDAGAHWRHE